MQKIFKTPLRVAIVGAGISGLSSAYYFRKQAESAGIPLELKLYEASNHCGGVIGSERHENFLTEDGPDSFISSKPEGVELARELGLEDQLIGTNPKYRRSFIVKHGKLVGVPEGFYLLSPISLGALSKAQLFSPWGKLRMACELFVPARRDYNDESLASFVRRRFGEEALERLAQPMVAGIYTADPERLSLASTFPMFLEYERRYGSVIRGLRESSKNSVAQARVSGPRYSLFVSFRHGMQTLTDTLTNRLSDAVAVRSIVRGVNRDETHGRYNLTFASGKQESADIVVLALPAWVSAKIVADMDAGLSQALKRVSYASSITLNFGFERSAFDVLPDGMGFVVPENEGLDILACSISSQKFEGRASTDHVLLRVFMGGASRPELIELDEGEISRRALDDVRGLLRFRGEPIFARVSKHRRAMAQYDVGHLDRVADINAKCSVYSGLRLVGNGYGGIGLPDCVREARAAVQELLLDYL